MKVICILISLFCVSCIKRQIHHGFVFNSLATNNTSTKEHLSTHSIIEHVVQNIIVGISSKTDVQILLGNPTMVIDDINMLNNQWYYVSYDFEWYAFFRKKTVDHGTLVISFDNTTDLVQSYKKI